MSMRRHTLVVLDPGHFHAALTLRRRHPALDDDVHVFAKPGEDLDRFLALVRSFNERAEEPTGWAVHVRHCADPLARLREERPGDIVVVAGRNDTKMSALHALHEDGFHVLGDKPWLVGAEQLPLLQAVTAGPPLALDIMTERHDVASRIQKRLVSSPDLFGTFVGDAEAPAIEIESVHHLYKLVNGRPLVRPAWYFDVGVQGEGIMDVTTHLVDLAQWFALRGTEAGSPAGVTLADASQWPTVVPLDVFTRITGLPAFPAPLGGVVEGDRLHLLCNGRLDFLLGDVRARVVAIWNLSAPDGGGDTHRAILRGTRAVVMVENGPETGFVTTVSVIPRVLDAGFGDRLADTVRAMQNEFPGIGIVRAGAGFRVEIPSALRSTHEEHFAAVLDDFLRLVDAGAWPADRVRDMLVRYTLLAHARERSHGRAV